MDLEFLTRAPLPFIPRRLLYFVASGLFLGLGFCKTPLARPDSALCTRARLSFLFFFLSEYIAYVCSLSIAGKWIGRAILWGHHTRLRTTSATR